MTNDRPTPETDAAIKDSEGQWSFVLKETCQRLERELDEAREELKHITEYGTEEINAAVELRQKLARAMMQRDEWAAMCGRYKQERDRVREALADWENAGAHVEADHPDEKHCGCVPVLRKLLNDARSERDEAREALASREVVIAQQKVITDLVLERDEAREIARAALESKL